MRFQVYKPALGSRSLNTQLENSIAEFQLAFQGNAENQRALKRIESGHLQLEEYLGKGYGVAIAPGQRFEHGEIVGWYSGALRPAEEDGGHFSLSYRDDCSLEWKDGLRRSLVVDGTPDRPGPPWSGNAARFNHACRKQTTFGRWRRFGGLSVLEFRANGELGEGTELTWSYERSGHKSYTVSESAARKLMLEGLPVDPCGCGRSEPCPARRFVPRADLVPERLVTGIDERPSGSVSRHARASGVIRPRPEPRSQRGRRGSEGTQGSSGRELVCRGLPIAKVEQEFVADDQRPSGAPHLRRRGPGSYGGEGASGAAQGQQHDDGDGKGGRSPSRNSASTRNETVRRTRL